MITLFTWPRPNGYKATIFMEELGLPYELRLVNLDAGEQFEPEFLKICPNNKVPAIIDDDTPEGTVTMFESGLIMMYLADKAGRLLPQSGAQRMKTLQWVFWQVSALGPWPGLFNYFSVRAPEKFPFVIERFRGEARRLLKVMDTELSRNEFLAGPDYSIADIACYVAARRAAVTFRDGGDPLDDMPHFDRWLKLVAARPGVERGSRIPVPIDWTTGNALPQHAKAV